MNLNPAAGSLSSTAFSLDYDTACLSINSADSNGDGIPEAISGLPGGFVNSVMLDTSDTDGELDVAMWDVTLPLASLPAGALLKIKFDILPACQGPVDKTTYVRFSSAPTATFSDSHGKAVYGATQSADPLLLDYNAPPAGISVTPSSVAENMPAGTPVGTLSVTDPDGDAPVYTLSLACSGGGAFANNDFTLVADKITTAAVFDFETTPSKTICVEANDGQGGSFVASLAISILNVNEPPAGIALNGNTVWEGAAAGTVVGSFSTSGDPETTQTHSYSLVGGDGSADNGKFTIAGDQLKIDSVVPDYAVKPVLYIRVRSTDGGGLYVEKQFVVNVLDHSQLSIGDDFVVRHNETVAIPVAFTANGNTPTAAAFSVSYDAACLTYVSTSGGTGSATGGVVTVSVSGSPIANGMLATLNFTANFACPSGTSVPLVFTAASLNDDALPVSTDNGKVLVIANSARGDCNSDGFVNAGDFSAIVLETFDTDLPWWLAAPQSTFPGSPAGCDANASTYIDVADVVCTVLVVFGNSSCTGGHLVAAEAAAAEPAVLAVAPTANGSGIEVPVTLDRKGVAVAAAAFTLTYDPQRATFDSTDADGDGLPDAVVFATNSALKRSVSVDAATGRIKIAVYGLTLPLPTLDDGLLATVHLQAHGDQPLTGLSLIDPALGADSGSNTPVEVAVSGVQVKPFIYLPAVLH